MEGGEKEETRETTPLPPRQKKKTISSKRKKYKEKETKKSIKVLSPSLSLSQRELSLFLARAFRREGKEKGRKERKKKTIEREGRREPLCNRRRRRKRLPSSSSSSKKKKQLLQYFFLSLSSSSCFHPFFFFFCLLQSHSPRGTCFLRSSVPIELGFVFVVFNGRGTRVGGTIAAFGVRAGRKKKEEGRHRLRARGVGRHLKKKNQENRRRLPCLPLSNGSSAPGADGRRRGVARGV